MPERNADASSMIHMRDVKPKTTRKYRKISPYEWIYLSATGQFPPFAIQLRIEVESLPPLSLLEEALAVAAEANPGARLTAAGGWLSRSSTPPGASGAVPPGLAGCDTGADGPEVSCRIERGLRS